MKKEIYEKWAACVCPVCGAVIRADDYFSAYDNYIDHIFRNRNMEYGSKLEKKPHGNYNDPVPLPLPAKHKKEVK